MLAAVGGGQHGTGVEKEGGHVQPGRRHQQAGNDLVARAQQHQRIKAVRAHHALHGGGDQVAAGQNVAHALVPLGDAVARGDGAKAHRRASGRFDAQLHLAGELVQGEMAGRGGGEGVDHRHQRTGERFVVIAHGFIQRALERAFLPAQQGIGLFLHAGSS